MLDNEKMLSEEEISKVSGGTGGYSGVPHVNEYICVLCGACADACPTGAISIDYDVIISASSCIACGCCVEKCPAHAIS